MKYPKQVAARQGWWLWSIGTVIAGLACSYVHPGLGYGIVAIFILVAALMRLAKAYDW